MLWALGPFAFALGSDLYIATAKIAGAAWGLLSGVIATVSALFFWYGLEAWHRAQHKEQGEETEHFYRFASRVVLAAMMPLAVGIAGDFFVVGSMVTGS